MKTFLEWETLKAFQNKEQNHPVLMLLESGLDSPFIFDIFDILQSETGNKNDEPNKEDTDPVSISAISKI